MEEKQTNRTLINITKKTFIEVGVLLLVLLALAIVLTYLVPKGEFGLMPDGTPDYATYIPRGDIPGIPWYQGVFAPILVFFSADGLTLAVLCVFLFVIAGAFQVMNDVGGIRVLVRNVAARFGAVPAAGGALPAADDALQTRRKYRLIVLISLLFYCFGAFLGLFEEMLTMLPIVAALCVVLGFDSFTGFLCCIISCGFGFASAITNPFTVILASEIIGVSPMLHIWYRVVIFVVMFALLQGFLLLYAHRVARNPEKSLTSAHDAALRAGAADMIADGAMTPEQRKKLSRIYTAFLLAALAIIVAASLLPALRGYTVVILIVYFLLAGIAAGMAVSDEKRSVFKSFGRGFLGALPTLVPIALAASIKYVFDRGGILPTIVHTINGLVAGHSPVTVALVIWLIVLLLEFFISSSTAKAIFVMGLLAVVRTGLTKEMLVLLYTFADGYTNVLFPTSPVLLISLSMIGVEYFRWVKKSVPLFLLNLVLVVGFIVLGVVIAY